MSLQSVGALTRAAWYQARSYRLSIFMQAGGLLVSIVPVYFVARALQPTMAKAIAAESEQYFAFILLGSISIMLANASMTTLQATVGGGIANGYFEALLMTRAPVPGILLGLTSYGILVTLVNSTVMLIGGTILGAGMHVTQIPSAILILAFMMAAYWGIGLMAAGMMVAFRTTGPLLQLVMAASFFFGGVYWPVSSIPESLSVVAKLTPLSYGLASLRKVLLQGVPIGTVAEDVAMLASIAIVLLLLGALAFQTALRYARRAGTLSTY
jgi:ABC-2 type transport system permease protein